MPSNLLAFTPEINDTLLPHIELLTLLHSKFVGNLPPSTGTLVRIDNATIPVLTFWNRLLSKPNPSREEKMVLDSGVIAQMGDLSLADQSRIAHWITSKIPNAGETFRLWMSRVPFIHAITILISSRHQSRFLGQNAGGSDSEGDLLTAAWEYQCSTDSIMRAPRNSIDVNRECIASLEERMFTRSAAAGLAGYYQWGLDAGDHQEEWWPWSGLPSHWYHNDTPDYDNEEVLRVWICSPLKSPSTNSAMFSSIERSKLCYGTSSYK